jgi:hypothetical protein
VIERLLHTDASTLRTLKVLLMSLDLSGITSGNSISNNGSGVTGTGTMTGPTMASLRETCKCGIRYTILIEYSKAVDSDKNVFFCWRCNNNRLEKLERDVEDLTHRLGSLGAK